MSVEPDSSFGWGQTTGRNIILSITGTASGTAPGVIITSGIGRFGRAVIVGTASGSIISSGS